MSKASSHILNIILRHLKSRQTFESVGIKQYRALLEKSADVFKADKSVYTESVVMKGTEALWLIPENHDSHRIVFYVHGGAGNSDTIPDTIPSAIPAIPGTQYLIIFFFGQVAGLRNNGRQTWGGTGAKP
jgi:hypothetical protein